MIAVSVVRRRNIDDAFLLGTRYVTTSVAPVRQIVRRGNMS